MEYEQPAVGSPHRDKTGPVRLFDVLLVTGALAFVPSGFRMITNVESLAVGLAVACAGILGLTMIGALRIPFGNLFFSRVTGAVLVLLAIGAHFSVTFFLHSPDAARATLSGVILFAVLVTAFIAERVIFGADDRTIDKAFTLIRWIFVGVAIMGIAGIQPPSSLSADRSVFPFSEPSHFALTFTPFLIHACVRTPPWRRVLWIVIGYAIAYLLLSLSLVVGTTLAALATLPVRQLVPFSIMGSLGLGALQLRYFTDRLDLSAQSDNISSLIYRQGWESARESLRFSNGWGTGFQQLGYAPVNVPTSDIIYQMVGDDSNIVDGGFVVAKLISEFGIFGIILAIGFGWVGAKCFMRLRAYAAGRALDHSTILASSFILGYSIEMLVRGIGYFAGTTVFLAAALVFLWSRGRVARQGASPRMSPTQAVTE